jgi:hypothetical protein
VEGVVDQGCHGADGFRVRLWIRNLGTVQQAG